MRTISEIVNDNEKSMFLYDFTQDFNQHLLGLENEISGEELRREKEYFLKNINLDITYILDYCYTKGIDVFICAKDDDKLNIIHQCNQSFISPKLIKIKEIEKLVENGEKINNSLFIYYRSFRGMTCEENKTFKIIKKSQEVFSKSVYVDAVTKEFLYLEYFPTTLKLMDYDSVVATNFNQGMEVLTNDFLYDRISIVNEGMVVSPDYSMFDVNFYGYTPYSYYNDNYESNINNEENMSYETNSEAEEEVYGYKKVAEIDIKIPYEEIQMEEHEKVKVNTLCTFVLDNLDSCEKLLDIILNEDKLEYIINGIKVNYKYRGLFFPRSEVKTISNFSIYDSSNYPRYNFLVKQYSVNTISLLKYLKRTFSNGLTSKLIFTFVLDIDYWGIINKEC